MRPPAKALHAVLIVTSIVACRERSRTPSDKSPTPPPARNCISFSQCGDGGPCVAAWPSELDGGKIQRIEVAGSTASGLVLMRCFVTIEGRAAKCRGLKPVPHAMKAVHAALDAWRGHSAWFCKASPDGGWEPTQPVEIDHLFQLHVHEVPDADVEPDPIPTPDPNAPAWQID